MVLPMRIANGSSLRSTARSRDTCRPRSLGPGSDARWELLADLRQSVVRILALFVFEGDRREGIATELMRAIEAWAKERGATRAFLNTFARSPSAVPFYEQGMGYLPNITGYWKQL